MEDCFFLIIIRANQKTNNSVKLARELTVHNLLSTPESSLEMFNKSICARGDK
jgi:hypothetical protein